MKFSFILVLCAIGLSVSVLLAEDAFKKEDYPNAEKKLYDTYGRGEYALAEAQAHELLIPTKRLFGDHENTYNILNTLGLIEQELGKFESSRAHYREGFEIAKRINSAQGIIGGHLFLAVAYEYQGLELDALENYEKGLAQANLLFEKLKREKIERASSSQEQLDRLFEIEFTVGSLHMGIGRIFSSLGKYEKAGIEYEQVLAIKKSHVGHKDASPTGLLDIYAAMGNLYVDWADFPKAKQYLTLGLKAAPDQTHPKACVVSATLGYVLFLLGQPKEAKKLLDNSYRELLKKNEKASFDTAKPLVLLGNIHEMAGYSKEALNYHEQAYAIRLAAGGPKHPATLHSLVHIAKVNFDLERYVDAEKNLLEIKNAYDEVTNGKKLAFGPFEYARVLARLGAVEFILGHPSEKIIRLYQDALKILDRDNGTTHPLTTEIRNEFGVIQAVYAAHGLSDWQNSWRDFSNGAREYLDWLGRIMAVGSQREHRVVLARQRRGLDQLINLAAEHLAEVTNEQAKELFGIVLSWKASSSRILLDRNEKALALVPEAERSSTKALYEKLQTSRKNIAHLLLVGGAEASSEGWLKQYDELEREFAAKTANYGLPNAGANAGPDDLINYLDPKAALIEFVRYRHLDFGQDRKDKALHWDENHYAAFLLYADTNKRAVVKFIPLGPASAIDSPIEHWRKLIEEGILYPRALDQEILVRLWQPIAANLPNHIRNLLVAPDGQLSLFPFEAIRLDENRYLIQEFMTTYLSTGRSLIPRARSSEPLGPPLIMADPDYGVAPSKLVSMPTATEIRPGDYSFDSLPGFIHEGRMVRDELARSGKFRNVELLVKKDATKEALFKLARPPELLYLTTHGRYLGDLKEELGENQSQRGIIVDAIPKKEMPFEQLGADLTSKSRARSVLALTGANENAKGLVNAFEVEGLNLWGTQLVVLSLCDSILGRVVPGEDVMGLRLAFQLAGARTVIGSLWRVSDTETEATMETFLRNWQFGNGKSGPMSKARALHESKLERIEKLIPVSFDSVSASPMNWAPFILHGDAN